jgi:hypothetical protein
MPQSTTVLLPNKSSIDMFHLCIIAQHLHIDDHLYGVEEQAHHKINLWAGSFNEHSFFQKANVIGSISFPG